MLQSPAADSGSFVPTMQFEKCEIHKVCLHFPNFYLEQNLSLSALVDLTIASRMYSMRIDFFWQYYNSLTIPQKTK